MNSSGRELRRRLIIADVTTLTIVWTSVLMLSPHGPGRSRPDTLVMVGVIVTLSALIMRHLGLLLSRRCAVRSTEMRLIFRTAIWVTAIMLLCDRVMLSRRGDVRFYVSEAVVGGLLMTVALTIERGVWRALLRSTRQSGRRGRPVVIVGCNPDAVRLVKLFRDHPDYGVHVVGVVGHPDEAKRNGLTNQWLGQVADTERLLDMYSLTGVVLAAGRPMEDPEVDDLVRRLLDRKLHIHLSTGVAGIDMSRMRQLPMAREPILYVENRELSSADLFAKRTIDFVGSLLGIVLLSPMIGAIALAIKLGDRGPVFYRQVRVGQHGKTFKVIKFRTMVPNADQLVHTLATENERTGPLFKMESDPRVTRIGGFLRMSSLDELPQLFNVLVGHMSLVGPRPALPSEIEEFDEELRARELVRPGITGLWQVEARDSPSFDAYRRLDLFYVENWSFTGDLAILLDTAEHLIGRIAKAVRRQPALVELELVAPPPPDPSPTFEPRT